MMRRVLLVALLALAVSMPLWTAAADRSADADGDSAALMEAVASDEFVDAELVAFVDVDSAADVAAETEVEAVQTPAKATKAKKPAKKAAKAKKAKAPKAAKAAKAAKAPKTPKAAKAAKPAKATKASASKAAKTTKAAKATKTTATTAKKTKTKTATKASAAAAKTSKSTKAKKTTTSSPTAAAAAKKLKASATKAAAKEAAAQKKAAASSPTAAAKAAADLEADMSEEGMRAKFEIFKAKRKKPYFSAATEAQAYRTFKKNRLRIHEMNNKFGKKGKKIFHSAGPFADVEPEEFKKKFRTIRPRTGAAPEPTAVPAKTVVRKSKIAAKKSSAKSLMELSSADLEVMAPISESDASFLESAAEAEVDMAVQVGTTCTEGVNGPVGAMMAGGSLRTCAEMQKWPAAGYDKTRSHMGMWCCIPRTVAEVVSGCEARGGRCMTDMRGKIIDDCVDQGNVWDSEFTGYCPDGAGGPPGPKGNRCCLPKNGAKPIPEPTPKPSPPPTPAVPASVVSGISYLVDYRFTTGKTTPVKNQGQCGSCWAHAAIQGLEAALLFAGKPSPPLSAQAIMDCRTWQSTTTESCKGGWYEDAYKYWQKNRAVTLEQYPYLAKQQTCAAPSGVGGLVKSWGYATPKCSGACPKQDEEQLLVSLKNYGPLSIYLDAASFQHYKGGILPAASCSSNTKDMDHAVQIVGYGTDNGAKFWVLRNSWGEKWGEAGYLRVEFGANTCGLANAAAFITV